MRHSNRKHKLGVSGPHRSAMMGNLAVALITHGRIETTLAKARALRPFIEKIITLAKKAEKANDAARKLHYRRLAIARVRDKQAVAQLFDERVSEFVERTGGYTRIYKVGQRIGDAAEMALIELIDGNDEGYGKSKKKAAKKATKKVAKPAAKDADADEAAPTTEEAPASQESESAEAAEPVEANSKEAAKVAAEEVAASSDEPAEEAAVDTEEDKTEKKDA